MIDTVIIGIVILFFLIVVISSPIIILISYFTNWIKLIKFIKAGRENNNCAFKINTTSDKIIITSDDWKTHKDFKKRLSLNYR